VPDRAQTPDEKRMSRGPADDADAPIEITPEIIEGSLEDGSLEDASLEDASLEAETAEPPDPAPSSFAAAATADPQATLAYYAEEAALLDGPDAAPLIHEVGHLQERALGDGDAALSSYRQALSRDPTFVATLGPLRRILAARRMWPELAALLEQESGTPALGADARADLLVERGRLLEDRLAQPDAAAAAYRAALAVAPEHLPALLALLLIASRTGDGTGDGDGDGVEAALAGLARGAPTPGRSAPGPRCATPCRRPATARPPRPSSTSSNDWRAGAMRRACRSGRWMSWRGGCRATRWRCRRPCIARRPGCCAT
jgi:tetratricopeptide (TPR) repeat protein